MSLPSLVQSPTRAGSGAALEEPVSVAVSLAVSFSWALGSQSSSAKQPMALARKRATPRGIVIFRLALMR